MLKKSILLSSNTSNIWILIWYSKINIKINKLLIQVWNYFPSIIWILSQTHLKIKEVAASLRKYLILIKPYFINLDNNSLFTLEDKKQLTKMD